MWDNLDDGIQKVLEQKATDINFGLLSGATWTSIGVGFLSEQWTQIIQSITGTFGDFTGIDVAFDVTSDYTLPLTVGSGITIPFAVNKSSSAKYNIANSSVSVIGSAVDYSKFSEYIQTAHKANTSRFLIIASLGGLFNVVCNKFSSTSVLTGSGIQMFRLSNNEFFYCLSGIFNYDIYFNGELLTYTTTDSGFTLTTADGANIVQDGYIINTNVPVSDSVCPDGIWDKVGFKDWLNDLAFGSGSCADVGNPSIDTSAYPSNDVWHDGSINDDIAIGSPSIGIAVPVSDEDVISLNPDFARDYENTTVKDKDIATDTDTDTSTDTDTDTSTPSNSTPSKALPALSLPEVLFKEKFPFCLPWDIYNLFSVLKAEPEAPKFVIPFSIKRFDIDENITIDFSDFEEQVKIFRFFTSASFVLGLILISRKVVGAE